MGKHFLQAPRLGVLAAGLASVILALDLLMPQGTGVSVLYVVVVIVALWAPRERFALAAALGATGLAAADLLLSPQRGAMSAVRHALAVAAVWATALLVYRHKITQRALLREQSEAQAYFDVAGVAIVVLDTDGRVRLINRQGCEILGLEVEDILGRPWIDSFVPQRERERTRNELARLVRDGVPPDPNRAFENLVVTSSGEERLIAWRNSGLRDPGGRISGIVSSGEDVTERRHVERMLRAQESLAKVGQLAAVVAHQVRNPLAGIRGAIQILGRRLPQAADRKVVSSILNRLDSLNAMTEDLLVYARPRPPELGPVRMSDVLNEARRLLAGYPDLAAVQVQVSGAEAELKADAELLQDAFLNLFLNAAQAMEGKGVVRVAVHSDGRSVSVDVEDGGPGIPDVVQERLFEPFFTTRSRGTGLGLPIVRRDVEAHGGEIFIACPEGGGTRVTVTLPREPPVAI